MSAHDETLKIEVIFFFMSQEFKPAKIRATCCRTKYREWLRKNGHVTRRKLSLQHVPVFRPNKMFDSLINVFRPERKRRLPYFFFNLPFNITREMYCKDECVVVRNSQSFETSARFLKREKTSIVTSVTKSKIAALSSKLGRTVLVIGKKRLIRV